MRPNPTVVFDTNIYISAILFGGNPRQCLDLARNGEINLISSRPILLELAEKLREKFLWNEEEVNKVIEGLLVFIELVRPKEEVRLIKKEPADNRILECALESKADFILSGDVKHLLSLAKVRGIPIISSKEFLDRFYRKAKRRN